MNITELKNRVIDKFLTWKTGKTFDERRYAAWKCENVNHHASSMREYFPNSKYIIEVNYYKIVDEGPFGDYIRSEFREQYMFPYRELGDHCELTMQRGIYSETGMYVINGLGTDAIFVATNNEHDATMIALKYK